MMKSTLCAAALLAAAALTACTTSNTIEGHQIKGAVEPVVVRTVDAGGLHARAPQWFKDYWLEYLRQAQGYAVMAVDRNARGAFYVYCTSAYQSLIGPQYQSWKDVNYKHGALKGCRELVRENYPAEKPRCAIYAIKDKIVWKGVLPWVR